MLNPMLCETDIAKGTKEIHVWLKVSISEQGGHTSILARTICKALGAIFLLENFVS